MIDRCTGYDTLLAVSRDGGGRNSSGYILVYIYIYVDRRVVYVYDKSCFNLLAVGLENRKSKSFGLMAAENVHKRKRYRQGVVWCTHFETNDSV